MVERPHSTITSTGEYDNLHALDPPHNVNGKIARTRKSQVDLEVLQRVDEKVPLTMKS